MDTASNIDLTEEKSFYTLEDLEQITGNSYTTTSPNKEPLEGYVYVSPTTKKVYAYLTDGIMTIGSGTNNEIKGMVEYSQIDGTPTDTVLINDETQTMILSEDSKLFQIKDGTIDNLNYEIGQNVYVYDKNGNQKYFKLLYKTSSSYLLLDFNEYNDLYTNFYSTTYSYESSADIIEQEKNNYNNLKNVSTLTFETLSEIIGTSINSNKTTLSDSAESILLKTVFSYCDTQCAYAIWLSSNNTNCLNNGHTYYNSNCLYSVYNMDNNLLYIGELAPTQSNIENVNIKVKYLYEFDENTIIYDEQGNIINGENTTSGELYE